MASKLFWWCWTSNHVVYTIHLSSGNRHFFSKKCHCKTLPKLWTTSSNISKFWFSKSIFSENWLTLSKKILWTIKYFYFLKKYPILLALFMILVGLTVTLFGEKLLISTKCIHMYMVSCPTQSKNIGRILTLCIGISTFCGIQFKAPVKFFIHEKECM